MRDRRWAPVWVAGKEALVWVDDKGVPVHNDDWGSECYVEYSSGFAGWIDKKRLSKRTDNVTNYTVDSLDRLIGYTITKLESHPLGYKLTLFRKLDENCYDERFIIVASLSLSSDAGATPQ